MTRDVTERERLAVARRQAEHAGALLSVIAHELRNPVGVLTGAAQTFAEYGDELLPEEREDLLVALTGSGTRLRRLLDDLLTASRLEASVLEVRPVEVPVVPLVADAVRVAAALDEGDVTLDVESGAREVTVFADPDRLQQMVTNLATNALRHGAPPVRVVVSADAASVLLQVHDHGSGVPEDIEDRVFDRFVTGNQARGTGLGLFIVKQLARAQGGDADYARNDGRSVFSVRLPRRRRLG